MTKFFKIVLRWPGQNIMILQHLLTGVPHPLATYEVQSHTFIDKAVWVADSGELATVLFIPAQWLIWILWWKAALSVTATDISMQLKWQHKFWCGMSEEQEQKKNETEQQHMTSGMQVLTCKQQHGWECSLWKLNKQSVWASAYLQCTEAFSLQSTNFVSPFFIFSLKRGYPTVLKTSQ